MAQCDARKQTIGGMILFNLPESVYNGHALVTQYLPVRRKKPVMQLEDDVGFTYLRRV